MNRKFVNKYKIKWMIVVISILLLIFYSFRLSTIFDEDYSLMLIHNSFYNIIKYCSIDVHPPLFYFLLKIFINITTFWTSSFLVKIISARIFSVIISLITFVFLVKLCNSLHLNNSLSIQWILFLLIPGVISFTYEFIKIRMYSLGALFVVIEFYELVKYSQSNNRNDLIIIIISCILSVYTNYYSGLISGIILLLYMIKHIFEHKRDWINILLSGILVIISFIPWTPILMKQLSLSANHSQSGFVTQFIATFVFMILFGYSLLYSHKHLNNTFNAFFFMSFYAFIVLFIFMASVSIISGQSIFEFRYVYPIFIIYGFLSINVLFVMIEHNRNKIMHYFDLLLFLFMCLICVGSYADQVNYYELSSDSIQIVHEFNKWKYTNNIHVKSVNNLDQGFNLEKVMYLSYIHKKFYAPLNINLTYKNMSYEKLFKPVAKETLNLRAIKR